MRYVFVVTLFLSMMLSGNALEAFSLKNIIVKKADPQAAILANSLKQYPARTELSKKALKLRVGMSKQAVYQLLGEPTWALSYKGMPLDWLYRNAQCNPVDVTFDAKGSVTGFDQGRAKCVDQTFSESLPPDRTLCSNPVNHALCQ